MGKNFKEEMIWMNKTWEEWSDTEQIVALYSVARKMNPVPTHFLQVLLMSNSYVDNFDISITESHANDPGWIAQVPESGILELLHHFPLLRPSNKEAKPLYLKTVHKCLAYTLFKSRSHVVNLEHARQLLSYALIHPALSSEERRSFSKWLKILADKLLQDTDSNISDENASKKNFDDKNATSISKSNEEITKDSCHWASMQADDCYELEHLNENQLPSYQTGLRDLGAWLKSLRLHKYSNLLCSLSYDELFALDEETLEQKGVTKGARHKIIVSISKLKERPKQLQNIEKELMNGGSILSALNQLKAIAVTPMPISRLPPDDAKPLPVDEVPDLPSQFVRVMGKVCTQLLVSVQLEEESVNLFMNLVDKCLNHESFTSVHAKRFLSWKQQIIRLWPPFPARNKDNRHPRRWSQQYPGDVIPATSRVGRFNQHRLSFYGAHLHPTFFAFPPRLTTTATAAAPVWKSNLLSPLNFLSKRPSLQETTSQLRPHVTLQRTRSAPSRPHEPPGFVRGPLDPQGHQPLADDPRMRNSSSPDSQDVDFTNKMESLCLSMTKHALE